jgi:hypothetical protein
MSAAAAAAAPPPAEAANTNTDTAATAATVTAMAAMADKLNHRRSVSLFVEDVERRQADIGDFLLTEGEVIRIIPWKIGNRTRR